MKKLLSLFILLSGFSFAFPVSKVHLNFIYPTGYAFLDKAPQSLSTISNWPEGNQKDFFKLVKILKDRGLMVVPNEELADMSFTLRVYSLNGKNHNILGQSKTFIDGHLLTKEGYVVKLTRDYNSGGPFEFGGSDARASRKLLIDLTNIEVSKNP